MIESFHDQGTEDVFNGKRSRAAGQACPPELWAVARRKLNQISAAERIRDLASPPNNRLEQLTGDRLGQYSIRINDQYRVCFVWQGEKAAARVEIVDYH